MTEREQHFTNYYCLSVYTMRIARFSLDMCRSYCAKPKLRNTLYIAEKAMDAKIADITLKLKPESRNDILSDLHSDDLQALGNILHHIIQLPSISDVEDQMIKLIRELKTIQNEKLESQTPAAIAEEGNDTQLQGVGESVEEPFQWPVIEAGWQRK